MSAAMKTREKGLAINLAGREFRVACPEGEEKQLMASVDYLNRKLKEIRDTGIAGNERIAMMAALNIAHEFLSQKGAAASVDGAAFRRRIVAMQEAVESALAADQENLF